MLASRPPVELLKALRPDGGPDFDFFGRRFKRLLIQLAIVTQAIGLSPDDSRSGRIC